MAVRHRLSNAATNALTYGTSGATLGYTFGGPKGAAIGAGIGTGIGFFVGLLSPTEQQELADQYARGEIDAATEARILRTLQTRFDQMRQAQGTQLARQGIGDSTMAARLQAALTQAESTAAADALTDTSLQRQQLGQSMLAAQQAARGQAVANAAQTAGNLYSLHQQNAFNAELLAALEAGAAAPVKPAPGLPNFQLPAPSTPQRNVLSPPAFTPAPPVVPRQPVPGGIPPQTTTTPVVPPPPPAPLELTPPRPPRGPALQDVKPPTLEPISTHRGALSSRLGGGNALARRGVTGQGRNAGRSSSRLRNAWARATENPFGA